jgi:hypothetical protein
MAADRLNITRGSSIGALWLKDMASLGASVVVMRQLPESSTHLLEPMVPPTTVAYAVARTVHKILEQLDDDSVSRLAKKAAALIAAAAGVAIASVLPIPMPLVAASLAGSKLLFDSVASEVVGTWFYHMERIGPEKLDLPRRVYNVLYKRFKKRVLYPGP